MQKLFFILATVMSLTMLSCAQRVELPDFDYEKWQNDKFGCQGNRAEMEEQIREVKDLLLRASEEDIIKTLGKADQNELYVRSQKYYIYYLSPAAKCEHASGNQTVKILRIRFNSMGFANEAVILERNVGVDE
jgi:hypothetical protein